MFDKILSMQPRRWRCRDGRRGFARRAGGFRSRGRCWSSAWAGDLVVWRADAGDERGEDVVADGEDRGDRARGVGIASGVPWAERRAFARRHGEGRLTVNTPHCKGLAELGHTRAPDADPRPPPPMFEQLRRPRDEIERVASRHGADRGCWIGRPRRGHQAGDLDVLVDMARGEPVHARRVAGSILEDLLGCAVRVVTTSSLRCARERIAREAVRLCSTRSGTSGGHSIFLGVDGV